MRKIKSFSVSEVSANGYLEGYASTWDRVPDCYGDVVAKGAFARTLREWAESGRKIPLLWDHQMGALDAYIGWCECYEDEKGLRFVGYFDDTPTAQRVRDLYKDGRLSKFSFAYDVVMQNPVVLADGTKANELQDLDLFEVSCVCVPANSFAEVLDVKSDGADLKAVLEKAMHALSGAFKRCGEGAGEDGNKANAAAEELKPVNQAKKAALDKIKKIEEEQKNEP